MPQHADTALPVPAAPSPPTDAGEDPSAEIADIRELARTDPALAASDGGLDQRWLALVEQQIANRKAADARAAGETARAAAAAARNGAASPAGRIVDEILPELRAGFEVD